MIGLVDYAFILVYFLALLFLGWKVSRKEDTDDFLVGNRSIRAGSLNATLSASLTGGSYFAVFVAFVYLMGASAIWLVISASIGLLVFIPFALKLKREGDKNGYYTLLDYFSHRWSRFNLVFSAALLLSVYFCLIISETIIGGKAFSIIIGLPYWISIIICSSVVFFYVVLGGFKSDVKTDLFQYIFIFLILFIGAFLLIDNKNVALDFNVLSAGILSIIGFILIGVLGIFVSADVWWRAYAARDEKSIKKGFVSAAISFFVVGIIMTVIALILKQAYPDVDPNNSLIYGFSLLPAGLIGIGLIAIISASMSTIDTCLLVGSMFVSKDIFGRYRNLSKDELIKYMRRTIIVLFIIGTVLSIFLSDLVFVIYNSFNFALILAPPVVGAILFNLKNKAVSLSLILGTLSAIVLIIINQLSADMLIVPFVVSVVGLIIGQIIFRRN